MRQWSALVIVVVAWWVAAVPASAQVIGSFTWQMQPYCNRITTTVTQSGGAFTLDGFDDQCGAAQRIPASGIATLNPDGTVALSLTMIGGLGIPVHLSARLSLPAASGEWRSSRGDTGSLVLGGAANGSPRPVPGAVIDAVAVAGVGLSPQTALNFIGPTATVTVTSASQRVHVVASKALGSVAVGGGLGLTLYVCARSTDPGAAFVTTEQAVNNLRVPTGTRLLHTLSHVFEGLSPGTHEVGLCGLTSNLSSWNDNERGYVTALVFQ